MLLPGLFAAWVEPLRAALDRLRAEPGPLSEIYGGDGGFYGDRFVWTRDAAIRDCVLHGPGGRAIAALMEAREVRLYCDHVLVKEPGTGQPTPWHHDLQAWPIEGGQIGSLWVALDPVTRENGAVEAGSAQLGQTCPKPLIHLRLELGRKGKGDTPGLPRHRLKHARIAMAEVAGDGPG